MTGDFDLAEEAVQEAFVVALERWPSDGMPANPGAWITTTARNRAIDQLRRAKVLADKAPALRRQAELDSEIAEVEPAAEDEMSPIADDRLRLIFTCCHPALPMDARVALTLRTLGGLTTPGDRPRVPRPRADPGPAARPGQEEDPRRGDPLPGPARPPAAGASGRRSSGCST